MAVVLDCWWDQTSQQLVHNLMHLGKNGSMQSYAHQGHASENRRHLGEATNWRFCYPARLSFASDGSLQTKSLS